MKGGETWVLTGLVKATHYNGQSVTLIRADDSGARWLVRLDAAVWQSRELTVRAVNLKKSHPRLSLPDKVVLAMSRLMDVVGDGRDVVRMCIDATHFSNLGRFLNHS